MLNNLTRKEIKIARHGYSTDEIIHQFSNRGHGVQGPRCLATTPPGYYMLLTYLKIIRT